MGITESTTHNNEKLVFCSKMSCRRLWLALPLMLLIETAHGFCTHPRSVAPCSRYRRGRFIIGHNNIFDTTRLSLLGIDGAVDGGDDDDGVQLVSLEGLGNDHEAVGETMAKSVVAWLDAEWMPQEIHVRMGVSVRNSYISCRDGGVDDVAEIMTRVTDGFVRSLVGIQCRCVRQRLGRRKLRRGLFNRQVGI